MKRNIKYISHHILRRALAWSGECSPFRKLLLRVSSGLVGRDIAPAMTDQPLLASQSLREARKFCTFATPTLLMCLRRSA
jgi:hypothetical protein